MKITISIIVITVLVFGLQFSGVVSNDLAFMPAQLIERPYTLITSVFMHSSLHHLLLNMLGLFIFGSIVENEIGWKHWLMLYIFAGIVGNLGYLLLTQSPFISGLGASGAIFGLMGAAAVLKPRQIIWTPYGPIPMIAAAVMWIIGEVISFFGIDNIAQSAHIFGLIGGAIFVYAYRKNINISILALIIVVVTVITFGAAIGVPKKISNFEPELNPCYNLTRDVDTVRYIESIYSCNNDYVMIIIYPGLTKVDPAYYNDRFPELTEMTYYQLFREPCKPNLEEINIKGDTVYTKGTICNHRFYNLAKNCDSVRIEVFQIFENDLEIKSISCEDLVR